MWLDVMATPDPAYAGLADTLRYRHSLAVPMRVFGLGLQGGVNHGLNSSRIVNGSRPCREQSPIARGARPHGGARARDEPSYGSLRSPWRVPVPSCQRQRPGQCGNVAPPAAEFPGATTQRWSSLGCEQPTCESENYCPVAQSKTGRCFRLQ
jgi:hypothetical protein